VVIYSSISNQKLAEAIMVNGTIRVELTKAKAELADWKHPVLIAIVERKITVDGKPKTTVVRALPLTPFEKPFSL